MVFCNQLFFIIFILLYFFHFVFFFFFFHSISPIPYRSHYLFWLFLTSIVCLSSLFHSFFLYFYICLVDSFEYKNDCRLNYANGPINELSILHLFTLPPSLSYFPFLLCTCIIFLFFFFVILRAIDHRNVIKT